MISQTDQLRLRRGSAHLHDLGPRAIAELLSEVAARIGGASCIMGLLADYEHRLTPEMLRAAGGDRFPPRPLREVA